MKKFQIILMAVLMAAAVGHSAVITNLFVNFESDTVGAQPNATSVRPLPASQAATCSVTVVTGSAIGTGNAVRYVDQSTNSPVGFEYNFVASSNHQENAVGVKFTYSQRSTVSTTGFNVNIAVGEYSTDNGNTLNSSTRRIAEVQIRETGVVRSAFNGLTANLATYLPGTVHTVEFFVNDQDAASVNYIQNGTTYSLAANSYSIYIDNISYGTGSIYLAALVDGGTATAATTQWNLGRFGITSASGAYGFDIDFDNIVVTSLIPEPATVGMLLLGSIVVLAVRRRRA